MKTYAGIGSRKAPADILELMDRAARVLEQKGYHLYSGGADGSDSAFAKSVSAKTIFVADQATDESRSIAKSFHPAWEKMRAYSQNLHGRNSFQVLGPDLASPVEFVLCWTPDSCISHSTRSRYTGGTGTAISIASSRGIPVFNLRRADHRERIERMVSEFNQ